MSATATPPVKDDFADWLNPMLVKELRQGLKTRVFVLVFVFVQSALVILTGFRLITQHDPYGVGGTIDGLLWTAIGAALLVLMPLRGLTAISEEDKANTLQLVQLTRLSSTRIVWGKWIALVSQTILLTVAILPYAVLRYFFGGIDVAADLLTLLWMLGCSLVLTAASLVLSTLPLATRILLLAGAVPALITLIPAVGFAMAMGGGFMAGPPAIAMIHAMVMTTLLLLALAASRIAPAAENHAVRIRLIALSAALMATIATLISDEQEDAAWFGLLLPMLFAAVLQALTERTSEVPSAYASLAKQGALGRTLGRFLYPGWATAMGFIALLVAMLGVSMISMEALEDSLAVSDSLLINVLLFVALCAPVLILLLLPSFKQRGWCYMLTQAACLLYWSIGQTLDGISSIDDATVSVLQGLTPTSAYLWVFEHLSEPEAFYCIFSAVPLGLVLQLILLVRSKREFRLIGEMESRALGHHSAE